MMSESEIQQYVQAEAKYFNCTLMRNNVGALKDDTGRTVRYGLGNISKEHNDRIKSSDLIGITTILITPDMVGQMVGVFTALEVKKQDWNENKKLDAREIAQKNFIDWVISCGGIASFINSVDKLNTIFRK